MNKTIVFSIKKEQLFAFIVILVCSIKQLSG